MPFAKTVPLAFFSLTTTLAAQIQLERVDKTHVPTVDSNGGGRSAVGDLNGDGLDDVFLAFDFGSPRIFRNLGGGRFDDRTAAWLGVGLFASDAVMLDIDGDSDVDVVTAGPGIWRNDGTGVLTDVTASQLLQAPFGISRDVSVIDADLDGSPDLFFTMTQLDGVLFLNDGFGSFTAAAGSFAGNGRFLSVLPLDVDSDGDEDLLTTRSIGGVQLFRNDGGGAFTDVTSSATPAEMQRIFKSASGDFDRDGNVDLLLAAPDFGPTQVLLWLGDGNGNFTDATAAHIPSQADGGRTVAAGDVDSDGDLDFVVGSWFSRPMRLYLNDGAGMFSIASPSPLPEVSVETIDVRLHDLDADSDLDLVAVHNTANCIYLQSEDGRFVDLTGRLFPPSRSVPDLAVDLDADSDVDLVGVRGGEVLMIPNDRGLGFGPEQTVVAFPGAGAALLAPDLNGDSFPDLAVSRYQATPMLFLSDGNGGYNDASGLWPPGLSWDRGTFGDVDGDGDLDMAVISGSLDRVLINQNPGLTAMQLPGIEFASDIEIADIDGDGTSEILRAIEVLPFVQNIGGVRISVFSGGTWVDESASRLPAPFRESVALMDIDLGDVDGDGDLDILRGDSRLLINDGTGHFTFTTAPHPPLPLMGNGGKVALRDLDDDGDLDAVFSAPRTWVNDGTGTFTESGLANNSGRRSLLVADFDQDDDVDFFAGRHLYQNTLQQLVAPDLAKLGDTYRLEARSVDGTFAVMFLNVFAPSSPIPSPFGTFLFLPGSGVTLPVMPFANGSVTYTLPLPLDPTSVGLTLYSQGAVLRPSAPLGIYVTNPIGDLVVL